jgi:hypothetical protein
VTVVDANKALHAALLAATTGDTAAYHAALKELQAASRGGNLPTPFPVVRDLLTTIDDERFATCRPKSSSSHPLARPTPARRHRYRGALLRGPRHSSPTHVTKGRRPMKGDTILQIERLSLEASETRDPRIAEKAIVLAEQLAEAETDDAHRFSALVTALKLRSRYGLGFTAALLATSARLEASSLDAARKKAKRKNIATIAKKHIDDPQVDAWLKLQDLTFTAEDLTPLLHAAR